MSYSAPPLYLRATGAPLARHPQIGGVSRGHDVDAGSDFCPPARLVDSADNFEGEIISSIETWALAALLDQTLR